MDEHTTIRARFGLRFRCANCRLVMCRELVSPDLADAPADVEELLDSNLLNRQFYACEACDNPVSTLIGVRLLGPGEVFEVEPDRPPTSPQSHGVGLGVNGNRRPPALPLRRLGERVGRAAH